MVTFWIFLFFLHSLKFHLNYFLTFWTDFKDYCECLPCCTANAASLFSMIVSDRTKVRKRFCTWSTQIIPPYLNMPLLHIVLVWLFRFFFNHKVTTPTCHPFNVCAFCAVRVVEPKLAIETKIFTKRHSSGMLTEPIAGLTHVAHTVHCLLLQWTRTSGRWL